MKTTPAARRLPAPFWATALAALPCLVLLLAPADALAQALTFDLGAETAGTSTGRIIQLIGR
jgi:hypothetical protein